MSGEALAQRIDESAVGPAFDPGSTRMGIIAVMIGLLVDPNVPAVSYVQGGKTIRLGFDGQIFRAVHLIEEERTYYF